MPLVRKPRTKLRVRTTPEQRATLAYLWKLLEENGCRCGMPARWIRRNPYDRIYILQRDPRQFFLLRAAPGNAIEVRPYDGPCLSVETLLARTQRKSPVKLRWNKRRLPQVRGVSHPWRAYLAPGSLRELTLLNLFAPFDRVPFPLASNWAPRAPRGYGALHKRWEPKEKKWR